METKILFINTNIWKVESSMTFEEAYNEIETAKKENRLAKIVKPSNKANLWDWVLVDNNAIEYLDLNVVIVYSYVDNTLTEPKEEKETKKKTK